MPSRSRSIIALLSLPSIVAAITLLPPDDAFDSGLWGRVEFRETIAASAAAAEAGDRLLTIVVTADYAAGSAELVADCLDDRAIVGLSRETVNFHYHWDDVTTATRDWVSTRLLDDVPGRELAVPQLVFAHPGGEVVLAVTGRLTRGEVEWAWRKALEQSGADVEYSDCARLPEQRTIGRTFTMTRHEAPPTRGTLAAVEAQLLRNPESARLNYETLVHSRSAAVVGQFEGLVGSGEAVLVERILTAIAAKSPREWATVAAVGLQGKDPELRITAARALRVLASPAALPPVIRALETETDVAVRQALLLALAASGPSDRRDALEQPIGAARGGIRECR